MVDTSTTSVQDSARLAGQDDIDLRWVFNVLVRWWREILVLTVALFLITAILLLLRNSLGEPVYEAVATVAISRTQSNMNLDEKFQINSQQAQFQLTDARARRAALLGLVRSGAIAENVARELGDMLAPAEKQPAELLESITAVINSRLPDSSGGTITSDLSSDLIQIIAQADSPDKAAAIANAWAKNYVLQVNAIYGQVATDLMPAIEAQLAKAWSEHDAAQAELEAFLAESKSDATRWQISNTLSLIDTYTHMLLSTQSTVLEREQQGRLALVNSMIDSRNQARLAAFASQVERDQKMLSASYQMWQRTALQLDDARALRTQLANGGEGAAASNAAALQLLKIQVFGGQNDALLEAAPDKLKLPADLPDSQAARSTDQAAGLRADLQVQLPPPPQLDAAQMLADVDALITTLEDRQKTLEERISVLSDTLLAENQYDYPDQDIPQDSELAKAVQSEYGELFSVGKLVGPSQPASGVDLPASAAQPAGESLESRLLELHEQLRHLRAQLEAEHARHAELQHESDLKWTTYTTLNNKLAELQVTQAAAGSEVRFAAPALPPAEPVASGFLLPALLAGVFGSILSVAIAFFAEYVGQQPFLRRRRKLHEHVSVA